MEINTKMFAQILQSSLTFAKHRLNIFTVLCKHLCVDFQPSSAHDATYDTLKLAECVAEALYRGVMLPTEPQGERIVPPDEQRLKQMFSKKPAVKKPVLTHMAQHTTTYDI